MLDPKILLGYFHKQNKELTLEDLQDEFGDPNTILKATSYLEDNNYLQETNNGWVLHPTEIENERQRQIQSDFKTKFEQAQSRLVDLQTKELKTKRLYAFIGWVGGIISALLIDYVLKVLKLKP